MKKPYENSAITDIEKASRGGVDAPSPALDIATLHGGRQMPAKGKYSDSGRSINQNNQETWKPIGKLAAALAAKAAAK